MIDIWDSTDSHLFCNPSYSDQDQHYAQSILAVAKQWSGHIWIATSGSSAVKWAGLSKKALLTSAHAVNMHLASHSSDRWIHALPDFHVGGLSIWARAFLSRAKVYDYKHACPPKWDASRFCEFIHQSKGSLTALVPTQIHDLIINNLPAPSSLRAVIVGGGELISPLYHQAIDLGWPLLPSYGLTECCSQVATAALDGWTRKDPTLHLLSHFQAHMVQECLAFSGPSLLTTYAYFDCGELKFKDPKVHGSFITEDRGDIQDRVIRIKGRRDSKIKIGGESVDLTSLENHFQQLGLKMGIEMDATLVAVPELRRGHIIYLAIAGPMNQAIEHWIEAFQHTVLPFERIRQIVHLSAIPRSPLGKILRSKLLDQISNLKN